MLSIYDHAWLLLGHESTYGMPSLYRFIGLLESGISNQAMRLILPYVYASYIPHGHQSTQTALACIPTHVDFLYLNDGSACEDRIVCWDDRSLMVEAWRVADVIFMKDEHNWNAIQWRLEHFIVDTEGRRTTYFWETLEIPIAGLGELRCIDTDNPPSGVQES